MGIILDTTGTNWTSQWFIGPIIERGPVAFSTIPDISHIGIGREDGAGANFSRFSLTVVPEPSAALLGGIGALLLLRRRRN